MNWPGVVVRAIQSMDVREHCYRRKLMGGEGGGGGVAMKHEGGEGEDGGG